MMDILLLQKLGLALLLGALVGLERERRYQLSAVDLEDKRSAAGLRTFALVGLLGAVSYLFEEAFLVFTAGFLLMVLAAYYIVARKGKVIGLTTEFALILVYAVGVLAARGEFFIATLMAIVITLLLHFKGPLHKWAGLVKEKELISTLQFAIVAFVILPLLPDQSFGYEGFFNPRTVWLMIVFISGLSFVSYLAVKFLGAKKGIVATGFLGGLVSSTALTLSFSEESKKNKKICNSYVVGVIVAGAAMFFRVLIEVAVVNFDLFFKVLIPFLVMGVVGFVSAVLFYRDQKKAKSQIDEEVLENIESPFSFKPALKFGLFFTLVLFVSQVALKFFGDQGLYVVSLVSGIVDVDAMTLFVAEQAKTSIDDQVAVIAIYIVSIVNTISKGVMILLFGERQVALRVVAVFALMAISGGVALLFV